MKKGTTGSVSEEIKATPEELYAMVADITRMGEWSPENTGGKWLGGAAGPAEGARFRGRNRSGLARWSTTCRVVVAEPGKEFAFIPGAPLLGELTKWRYTFEPADAEGVTKVTESFEMLKDLPGSVKAFEKYVLRKPDRYADLLDNMGTTLSQLKATAESA